MHKSVYSLVLSDGVVQRIDQMAYARGLSRSALIDEILAEHASMVTPQMHASSVFEQMERLICQEGPFQALHQSAAGLFAVRGVLPVKYRPAVRYQVELHPQEDGRLGQLKASFRTQSSSLLRALGLFFQAFMQAESAACSYAEGRFQKELRLRRSAVLSADETAQAISNYIQLVDGALQAYLSLWPDHAAACQAAARQRALYEQGDPLLL